MFNIYINKNSYDKINIDSLCNPIKSLEITWDIDLGMSALKLINNFHTASQAALSTSSLAGPPLLRDGVRQWRGPDVPDTASGEV